VLGGRREGLAVPGRDVVADDPEIRDLLLPLIVADFRLAVGYRYRAAAPLAIPVSLINGDGDPHVVRDDVAPWHRETLAPPAEHWTPGGHFYFEDDPGAATRLLRDVVQADQHVELI
jgi:medium-chain acyl-[acyl-carrier-protein] hydrolase